MEIPEWIISIFDVQLETEKFDIFSSKEFPEMTIDFKAKFMSTFKISK